jgi:hypothetical protein
MPQWTQALTPLAGSDLDASLQAGKITLAHATLEIIRALGKIRTDLPRMQARYPTLAALLDGRSQLPPCPPSTGPDGPKPSYKDGTSAGDTRESRYDRDDDSEPAA